MCDEVKKEKTVFPNDFWTRKRPHVTEKENAEDMIPFKWSKDVLSGKRKAILYSVNGKKQSMSDRKY